ncbi:hypothetical protein [Tabrizicola sp.]|uniref:hypothetical protein n=1 Tax=Tabrizicola sp. TaxID=2005166 RepID=UPI0027348A1B|nr:hypothetical protein [Tabrizicola sp.]MDP3194473.1 hypothetical protein [Tabrizicola sp.]
MRAARWQGLVAGITAFLTALPVCANRLTFDVRPDPLPDHAVACSVALTDGWISLVRIKGFGMPAPQPFRWRTTQTEEAALLAALEAFVYGDPRSVEAYHSRPPAPPFVSVTWMTSLDGELASGLYLQPGLHLPRVLASSLESLGLDHACGLSATTGG